MAYFKKNELEANFEEQDDDSIFAKVAVHPLLAANCSDYVVAHSNTTLRPVRQLSEVSLLPHILQVMHKLHLTRLLRVQSHTWRHLLIDRGHGAMVVGAPRSGRTLSYIPPVCDMVSRGILQLKNQKGHWSDRKIAVGPQAVILVPDQERARQVSNLCSAFLQKIGHDLTYSNALTVPLKKDDGEFSHRLLNGIGCLVATPAQLIGIVSYFYECIRFKDLMIIVYDDIDLMDARLLAEADQALKRMLPMDRSHPQLVIVSQVYDRGQLAKLKLLNSKPALIFGDMLEAALYGETRLKIVLSLKQNKIREVLKMLEQRPPKDYRTLIFCSEDADMRRLVGQLEEEEHSYECLPYYQDSNLEKGEQVQRWLAETQGIILLATDNCPELNIRHAHTLIHFGMSSSWSKFKMRHLALSGNLSNKLASNSREEKSLQLQSLILLDDTNQKQLPRLVDFVHKHQPVDEALLIIAKQIRQQQARLDANPHVVCRQIMLHGDCITPNCEERHYADQMDKPTDLVPKAGDIKLRLVRVYSPTHFCAYLLEHLPPNGSWQALPSLPVQNMRLQMLQSDGNSFKDRYWPPIAGNICLYRMDSHKVRVRVRVLKVAAIENVNLCVSNLNVLVQGLDEDTRIFTAKSGQLYKCSEELQAQPPMAIDLRLLGKVPESGEREWSKEECRFVESKLENLPQECFLQASVQFATAHTIFIRNLAAIMYASNVKVYIRKVDLCQLLNKAKMAKSSQQAKDKIEAFFGDVVQDVGTLKNDKLEEKKEEVDEQLKQEVEKQLKEEVEKQVKEKVEKQLKEETKENDAPNKPLSKGRAFDLIQMGIEQARQTRLAKEKLEQEQKAKETFNFPKKLEQESKQVTNQQAKEASNKQDNNTGMQAIIQCLNNIAKMEMEDAQAAIPDQNTCHILKGASKLLDQMENGGCETSVSVNRRKKQPKMTDFKVTRPPRDPKMMQSTAQPPNVLRPPTTYYQTPSTLELQVLLPEDNYKYTALLTEKQLVFLATHSSTEILYQFTLRLGVPYSTLTDYKRGRTVYVSLKKTVARPDLMDFQQYQSFLKPNHEKFNEMEDKQQEEQINLFAKYARQVAFKEKNYDEYEWEDSDDEEPHVAGIERGDTQEQYED